MLIIGHRGAAGIKPENTIVALQAALQANADMVKLDICLTKDNVPVLSHDSDMLRTNRSARIINQSTLVELQKRTTGSDHPIATLDAALRECVGKILVNVELKQSHSFTHALPILKNYIKKKSDWELFLFSSFSSAELARVRKMAPHAQLGLLHYLNPFLFIRYMRQLNLAAVGFHRLHINSFTLAIANELGLFTYAYTVNRPQAALRLAGRGIDGIVTDRPDVMTRLAELKNS